MNLEFIKHIYPLTINKWKSLNKEEKRYWIFKISIAFIYISFVVYAIWDFHEARQNKVYTKASVISTPTGRSRSISYLYKVDDKIYKAAGISPYRDIAVGDSIMIFYNAKKPTKSTSDIDNSFSYLVFSVVFLLLVLHVVDGLKWAKKEFENTKPKRKSRRK